MRECDIDVLRWISARACDIDVYFWISTRAYDIDVLQLGVILIGVDGSRLLRCHDVISTYIPLGIS